MTPAAAPCLARCTRYRRRANVAVGVAIPVTAPATRPVRQIAGPPGFDPLVSFSRPPLTVFLGRR